VTKKLQYMAKVVVSDSDVNYFSVSMKREGVLTSYKLPTSKQTKPWWIIQFCDSQTRGHPAEILTALTLVVSYVIFQSPRHRRL